MSQVWYQTLGFLQPVEKNATRELFEAQNQDQAATCPEQEPTELPGCWLGTRDTSVELPGSWGLSFGSSIQAWIPSSSDGLVLSSSVLWSVSPILSSWALEAEARWPGSGLLAPRQVPCTTSASRPREGSLGVRRRRL